MATTITFSDANSAEQPDEATGICPECWGSAPIYRNRIAPHRERVIKGGVEDDGKRMCPGRGHQPRQVA